MFLDDIDKKVLEENFDIDMINLIDEDNVLKIFNYLKKNGIYYFKDLFLSSLDIFLLDYDVFVERFELLKNNLGVNYVDMLGEDTSLIELMY